MLSYLTDYRMDRAEEMVLNTDEKSYKIAEKVGYQDANYFSYVFKKKFGVSPSKYRASGNQKNGKQKSKHRKTPRVHQAEKREQVKGKIHER